MLRLHKISPLKAQNAGLFISRGNHKHPTRIIYSHELIFVKHGTLDMWEDERNFTLSAGQTLHLWPNRRHGSVGELPPELEFYWIHFEVEDTLEFSDTNDAILEVPQVKRVGRPDKLEYLFRYFLDEQEAGYLEQCAANMFTMLMLLEVARPSGAIEGNSDTASTLATRADTYIRLNFDRPITAGKVALALGYNADYLGRVYQKAYGYTLTEAIHRHRVRVACRFLLDTNMIIEEIAKSCGFADSNYFRRIFQRYMHSPPRAYRKQYARVHVNTH